jgi:ubiquinone/menaquinone biosynthesis C-methylase UbiE
MAHGKAYVDIAYLRLAAEAMSEPKRRSYELMALQPGGRALDLGCGPGTDTLALAAIVGPRGEVHGVDHDASMVDAANERAELAGIAGRVLHHCADAAALPWRDGAFDASRSERVFQHMDAPQAAFAELLRVTRRGGSIVVLDTDWGSFSIDADEPEIERRLVQFHAEQMMTNPYSGRALHRLFHRGGLLDLVVEIWPVLLTDVAQARALFGLDGIEQHALAAGVIDADESRRWRARLARAEAGEAFYASTNLVMVAGCVP